MIRKTEFKKRREGRREGGRAVIAVATAFGLVEGRARLLLSSRCQRNKCWNNWDARLSTNNFLAGWIAWTGLISSIPCKMNPNEQTYVDLKNGWDIHRNTNGRIRTQNSGLGQVDDDKRAVRETELFIDRRKWMWNREAYLQVLFITWQLKL